MSKIKKYILSAVAGCAAGLAIAAAVSSLIGKTSSNDECMSCHVHTEADNSWKKSSHAVNGSGVTTGCAECHLPPRDGSAKYFAAKVKFGIKDLFSYVFKDKSKIDWSSKRSVEYATGIVYEESCIGCHTNLYPEGISDNGITSHLYFEDNREKLGLECINCHVSTGHFDPNFSHAQMTGVPPSSNDDKDKFTDATEVTSFGNFTETVPGTHASINMVAVPGGEFTIGSPENEAFRRDNEGPQKNVRISPFFMSETEVTWDQFWAFYGETMSEGRTPPEKVYANNSRPDVDAVSGPTPPFGNPDQGWGMGDRPAITMTHYAATTFCQWLSLKTGKTYRLPTEAEWEYAARGGSRGAYFFGNNPRRYSSKSLFRNLLGTDTTSIDSYVIYAVNSSGRTQTPDKVKANPFGLKNMLGNVMEYCSDWYADNAYDSLQDGVLDPKGPWEGNEHVVRGGMYSDLISDLRCAARGSTHNKEWLKTDPQNPKSIWWYSDIKGIGFRIVCEVPENIK